MRSRYRKAWDNLYEMVELKWRGYQYRQKMRALARKMHGGYDCRAEYRQQILPYWARFGQKPDIMWYRLFSAKDGVVDPRYIPDDMWFEHIVPYFSNSQFRRLGEDKCLHGMIFPDAPRPRTIAANMAGVYYDDEYRIITREEAARRCAEYRRFLIKPSIDSGEGRLIRFYDECDPMSAEQILKEFDTFGCNFLAQEVVSQHPVMAAFNPSSLNTVRIVSFLFEGNVHILSAIVRFGGNGSRIDNVGAGGFACGILPGGHLKPLAVNKDCDWLDRTSSGIVFGEVTVPGFDKAAALAKKLHPRLAHFKLVGWDFGITPDAEPVLIEFNTVPGQNQYECGPTFGDLTERVLEDVFIKKTLRNSRN